MRTYPMTFLLGLFLGLSIGMLLAPARGSVTRHMLQERAGPALERVKERVRHRDEE
jgi:gas vesicle protein